MMTGWIRVHRPLAEHQIWLRDPFTMAQAWVDLMRANYHKSHGRLDEEKFDGRVSDRIDPRPALPIYLTPKKVARMLEVDERTVLRWAAEDPSMPTIRIGRVIRWEQEALFRWLAKKRPRKSMS